VCDATEDARAITPRSVLSPEAADQEEPRDRPMLPNLMDIDDLARYCKVSRRTVEDWNHSGSGPSYFKTGKRVRYSEPDVLAWLESRRRCPTKAANPAGTAVAVPPRPHTASDWNKSERK
jgi:excisionase family DNA binding protein